MKTPHILLWLLATSVSCVTPPSTGDDSAPSAAANQMEAEGPETDSKSESVQKATLELAGLEREVESQRLALVLEELESAAHLAEAQRDVGQKERDLRVAREQWAHFRDVESELELSKSQLEVDRALSRLEAQRQDLEGILEIYEGEEEARAKEEIIRRNRKDVEFAQKALEQVRMQARLVAEFEVPQKLESLQWDLGVAEADKQEADQALQRAELKARLDVKKAGDELAELEEKLQIKRAELAMLHKKRKSEESDQ